MAGAVADFTDEGFEREVLKASGTVLVDFWAAWCGPCRLIAPLMDWVASDYGDRVIVGKLESADDARAALERGARSSALAARAR